jgi:hypothetical protein
VISYFLFIFSYWIFFFMFSTCFDSRGFISKFESFQCEDVSLAFVDCHHTMKHFNCFEYVEHLFMTIVMDYEFWPQILCHTWSNYASDIFHLGFHKNTKTMFLSYVSMSYVSGIIFECDKFWGLHFDYLSYVSISLNSHLFWIVWMLTIHYFLWVHIIFCIVS